MMKKGMSSVKWLLDRRLVKLDPSFRGLTFIISATPKYHSKQLTLTPSFPSPTILSIPEVSKIYDFRPQSVEGFGPQTYNAKKQKEEKCPMCR